MDETVKSRFTGGYVHRALVSCPNCRGLKLVDGDACGACGGEGKIEAGCGGAAEVDEHYGSANCIDEGMFVPREEVSES